MQIILLRRYYDNGTNGKLFLNGKQIGLTIELPWKENKRMVSCIPEGTYSLRKRYTGKFGLHLCVENVPNRDAILIHVFNDALAQSKGCIGPVTEVTGHGKGLLSRHALDKLLSVVMPELDRNKTVFLTIKNSNDGIDN